MKRMRLRKIGGKSYQIFGGRVGFNLLLSVVVHQAQASSPYRHAFTVCLRETSLLQPNLATMAELIFVGFQRFSTYMMAEIHSSLPVYAAHTLPMRSCIQIPSVQSFTSTIYSAFRNLIIQFFLCNFNKKHL